MPESQKKFFDIFKKYLPDREKKQMLEEADNVRIRIMRDPYRVEVEADFPRHNDQRTLHAIEDELRVFYNACSFRIFPHYPQEDFTAERMEEIFEEASRSGAITRGFFSDAEIHIDNEENKVEIKYDCLPCFT